MYILTKKNITVFFSLVLLNTLGFFYDIGYKLNVEHSLLYLLIVPILFLVLVFSFKKTVIKNFKLTLFITVYFLFQFFNGLYFSIGNNINPSYSLVTLISFILTIYLLQVFSQMKTEQLIFYIEKVFLFNIVFYILINLLSYLTGGNAGYLLAINSAPIILIAAITLSLNIGSSKYLIYCVLFFIAIHIFPLFFSTIVVRFQFKVIAICIFIVFIFSLVYLFRKIIPRLNIYVVVSISIISLLILVYLFKNDVSIYLTNTRGTSFDLRLKLGQLMLSEILNGNVLSLFFGSGLGSSMQEWEVYSSRLADGSNSLGSHSGLLSILYEHGLGGFSILFLGLFMLFILPNGNRGKDNDGKIIRNYNIFIFLTLLYTWIFLNVIYYIAINIPLFVGQNQLILVLLLSCFLKKKAF